MDRVDHANIAPTAPDRLKRDAECRKIVQQIRAGLDEGQKLTLIRLLALELESNAAAADIVNAVRPYLTEYRLVKEAPDDPDPSGEKKLIIEP